MGIFGDLNLGGADQIQNADALLDEGPKTDAITGEPIPEVPFDPNSQADVLGDASMNDQQAVGEQVNREAQEAPFGVSSQANTQDEGQGTSVDAHAFNAGVTEQFANSLARGVGTAVGGLGYLFQAGGGALGSAFGDPSWWKGNSMSDFLHGFGDEIQGGFQNYVPEQFKEVKMENLGSLEGWKYLITNQIAETIPYMAEFILTGFGAGSLAKKGATSIAKKQIAKHLAKGGSKNALRGIGRDGVELAGKRGIKNLLLTEKGLSKTGGAMAHAMGAGAANNQLIAISQSAEAVNEANMMKKEDGSPMFNDDDLAEIGKDTYLSETSYIGLDIASWAFTFGKLDKGLLRSLKLNKAPGTVKTTGQKIAKRMQQTAKVGFKAAVEGGEETIQEVFEEWAKKKSIEEAKLRKGLVSTNKYSGKIWDKGFTDYYSSKETEGLRIVAGITGGLMAGGKASIDLIAEKQRLIADKEELLKVIMPKAFDGDVKTAQTLTKDRVISDIVHQGRQETFNETLKSWVDAGSMTPEEYTETVDKVNKLVELQEQSENLSIEGTDQLYFLLSGKLEIESKMANTAKVLQEQNANADKLDISEEARQGIKEKAQEFHDVEMEGHQNALTKQSKTIDNHILGIKAEGVIGEDGKIEGYRGFNKKDYARFTETGKAEQKTKVEEAAAEAKKKAKDIKEKGKSLVDTGIEKGKELFDKGKAKAKKIQETLKNYNEELTDEALAKREKDSSSLSSEELNAIEDEFGVVIEENLKVEGETQAYNLKNNPNQKVTPNKRRATAKINEILKAKKTAYEESLKEAEDTKAEIEKGIKTGTWSDKVKKAWEKVKDVATDVEFAVKDDATPGKVKDKATELLDKVLNKIKGNRKSDLENITETEPKAKATAEDKVNEKYDKEEADAKSMEEQALADMVDSGETLIKEEDVVINDEDETGFFDSNLEEEEYVRDSEISETSNNDLGAEDEMEFGDSQPRDKVTGQFRKKNKVTRAEKGKAALSQFQKKLSELSGKLKETLTSDEVAELKKDLKELSSFKELNALEAKAFKFLTEKIGIAEKIAKLKNDFANTDVRRIKKKIGIKIDKLKKKLKEKATPLPNVEFKKEKLTEEQKDRLFTIDEIHSLNGQGYDLASRARLLTIRENLKNKFPGVDILMINDIASVAGTQATGYAVGSAIYINPDSLNQLNTLAHELSHVYYAATKNTPATQRLVDHLMRNNKLVNWVRDTYWEEIRYEVPIDGETVIVTPQSQMEASGQVYKSEKAWLKAIADAGHVLTESPMSEQEALKDEVFAWHMENDLTENYDKYFSPMAKKRSNFLTRKFWENVRSKMTFGISKTQDKEDAIDFLKDLGEDGIPTQERHLKTFMLNKFKKGFDKDTFLTDLRTRGRARKGGINTKRQASVENSIRNQKGVFDNSDKGINLKRGQKLWGKDFNVIAEVHLANDDESYESGNLDDKTPAYNKSFGEMITDFERAYNKKFYSQIQDFKMEPVDKFKIKHTLDIIAQESDSNLEFIDRLENMESTSAKVFVQYMKAFYENDYEARMVSVHTALANNLYMDSFSINGDEKGLTVEPGVSAKDRRATEDLVENLQAMQQAQIDKARKKKLSAFEEELRKSHETLAAIAGRVVSNTATEKDLKVALAIMSSGQNTDLNTTLFVDGKPVTMRGAVKSVLKRSHSKAGNYDRFKATDARPFLKSIVAHNKYETGSSTVENVEGNNISMYHKQNFMTSELRRMSKDIAKGMKRVTFKRKYDNNPLAMKMFDNGKVIRFQQFLGSKINDLPNLYKNGTQDLLFLNDMVLFLKGGAKSYMQSAMMNADSPRRYYASVPKIIFSQMNGSEKMELFNSIAEIAQRNGDVRFNGKDGKVDGSLVNNLLKQEVEKIKNLMEKSPDLYASIQKMTGYEGTNALIKDNKLTPVGKTIIESYAINHLANQMSMRDLFAPKISESQMNKRGKSSTAPNTPINSTGDLRMGFVVIKDLEYDSKLVKRFGDKEAGEVSATDSMNFMLPEDIERAQAIYGGTMKVGKNHKYMNFSKERENTNLKGNGIYIKGLTFPLTDEFVKEHPQYRALRDLLRAQKEYYINNHRRDAPNGTELSFNLNDGTDNFIPFATAESGVKTGLSKEQISNAVTLEEMESNPEKAMERVNALNEFDVNKSKKGYGINGSNFGVQNQMDKEYTGAVFASQLQSALLTNASVYGTLADAESILGIIKDISDEAIMKEVMSSVPKGESTTQRELDALNKFVRENVREDLIDPVTGNLLGNFSTSLPMMQEKASQIMKNKIVRVGNKLYTTGGVGLQMSDYGFVKTEASAGGKNKLLSSTLKPYGVGGSGAKWTETFPDGRTKEHIATVPAESILPHYLVYDENGKQILRTREYMGSTKRGISPNSVGAKKAATAVATQIAIKEAGKLFHPKSKSYRNHISKLTAQLVGKDKKGYFVRGEFVLGSRIPSHGLQTTLVLEAKSSTGPNMGSAIIIPSELSAIMGSDLDGDAIYLNTTAVSKNGKPLSNIDANKNKLKNAVVDYMTNEASVYDMLASLNMKEEKANVIKEIETYLDQKIEFKAKESGEETDYPFLPTGQKAAYNDNLQTRNLVGISAALHRFIGIISAYDTKFDLDFKITTTKGSDTRPQITSFSDKAVGIKARFYKTATLLNVILDNASERMAEKIGITPATAPQFIILAGMGYKIAEIAVIMNSKGAKAWIQASENRNNPYYTEQGKHDTLENARKIANVKGPLPDDSINIALNDLDTESGKRNVIELLSELDTMQAEMFKLNKILSGHAKLETDPFVLEQQMKEAQKIINGEGMLQFGDKFKNNPLVTKYMENHKRAIEVDSKTNINFSKTNRALVDELQEQIGGNLKQKDLKTLGFKLNKVNMLSAMMEGYNNSPEEYKATIYGGTVNGKTHTSVYEDLLTWKMMLQRDEDTDYKANKLLTRGISTTSQLNDMSIKINPNFREYGNDTLLEQMRKDFNELPDDLKDKLIMHDFVEYGFKGKNSIFPLFDTDSIQFFANRTDKMLMKDQSTLADKQKRIDMVNRLTLSMHNSLESVKGKNLKKTKKENGDIDWVKGDNVQNLAEPGSSLFKKILSNKPFVVSHREVAFDAQGKTTATSQYKELIRFTPFTDEEIGWKILENGGKTDGEGKIDLYSLDPAAQQEIVNEAIFTKAFRNSTIDTKLIKKNGRPMKESPLFKDLNLLTKKKSKPKGPLDGTFKKKSSVVSSSLKNSKIKTRGRSRLKGSENFTQEMSKTDYYSRNDIVKETGASAKAYAEYKSQYARAKDFAEKNLSPAQLESMPEETLRSHLNSFYQVQAEAGAIATNLLRNELGKRISANQSSVTGVKGEKGDLSAIQKWFISSNIPSRLPGLQAIAKKVNEKYKSFLRERSKKYDVIKKATENLYKEKYGKSLGKYNPLKSKDYYRKLYGNLMVEELVGKDEVRNIRLKDADVVAEEFANGTITKAEKEFYDVFTSITNEYGQGMSEADKRRGYIPHTSQSIFESYANRGLLGVFMNSQSNEQKMNDVKLKGYDPILDKEVIQSYKKFKDAYDAMSQNKETGNINSLQSRKIFMITKRAERLAKKNINEDGSQILLSNLTMDTLMDGGVMDRFTKSRSNKSTEFPSMDLNKALMDYTHASIFNKNFKSMLPEIDSVIMYYKNIGNENAVEILEKYYKGKILRGESPTSILGKTGDKVLKTMNALTVFKFLGFNLAVVTGNVLAGKYHNVKNNGGKAWVTGEKRFWGLHKLSETGVKGVFKEFRKSMELLTKMGFMEQNVYEELSLEKEWNPITKLQNLAFLPMTLSEKWIQGVQFLGQLSEEEWEAWTERGELLSTEKQIEYENITKSSQGRGYNYTDQRLISLYSLGQSFMMFSRFIPTMMQDRFGGEDVDAYGRKYVGSLNQFGKTAADLMSGRMRLSEFNKYKESLPEHQQVALMRAVNGMGLVVAIGLFGAGAGALGDDDTEKTANKLIADANYAINLPKFVKKTNLPVISSTKEVINSISNNNGKDLQNN